MNPQPEMDVWTKATERDVLTLLSELDLLPSRASETAERDVRAYHVALRGVTRWSLWQAYEMVLQNRLRHPFFPSPPELRGLCDAAMKPHLDALDRKARLARMRDEEARYQPVQHSPEERSRVQELVDRFHASLGSRREATDLAAIRAKYGDALSTVPDRQTTFTNVGSARQNPARERRVA